MLALDYMKRTKKLTPEVHAKAEGFIANGYQRLLTFEVPGGGFSWFGQAPANKILTAYGLMEFSDMSQVYDVDPRLIQRTQQWLAAQQQPDGSWKPDTSFINEGATNRYNSDVLRITAYIAWALENTGYQGPAVEKAKRFVEAHLNGNIDAYTLAVVANFAADYQTDRAFTRQAMQLLLDARIEKDDQAWWTPRKPRLFHRPERAVRNHRTRRPGAAEMGTGLSHRPQSSHLHRLEERRRRHVGNHAGHHHGAAGATARVTEMARRTCTGLSNVLLNGKPVEKLCCSLPRTTISSTSSSSRTSIRRPTPCRSTSMEMAASPIRSPAAISFRGTQKRRPTRRSPSTSPTTAPSWRRTTSPQPPQPSGTISTRSANMVMVDLGIPPGFDLLSEDLQAYQEKSAGSKTGRLEKFNLTATQAILYFNSFAPGETVTLHFRLRAKYPIRARTFQSRVYEYYDPEVSSIARPVQLEVRPR